MTCQPTRLQAASWFLTSPSLRPPQAGLPTSPASQMGQSQSQIGRPLPNLRLPHSKQGQLCPKLSKSGDGGGFLVAMNSWDIFSFIFLILSWENHTILIKAGHKFVWSKNNITCMLQGKRRCVLRRIGLCKCGQCPCLLPPRGMHCLKPPSGPTHLQYLHTQKKKQKSNFLFKLVDMFRYTSLEKFARLTDFVFDIWFLL